MYLIYIYTFTVIFTQLIKDIVILKLTPFTHIGMTRCPLYARARFFWEAQNGCCSKRLTRLGGGRGCVCIPDDDKPQVTGTPKALSRHRKVFFLKNRTSPKWQRLSFVYTGTFLVRIFEICQCKWTLFDALSDVCTEKLTCHLFTRKMRVNARRGKCAVHLHTRIKCVGSTQKMCGKYVPV